jgi:hypothetical protein
MPLNKPNMHARQGLQMPPMLAGSILENQPMNHYEQKDGMIYDFEDGQTIATMSESATPEQA